MSESNGNMNKGELERDEPSSGHLKDWAFVVGAGLPVVNESVRLYLKDRELGSSSDGRNVFVTGIHAEGREAEEILKKFANGDPDANGWMNDTALVKAISVFRPNVLTVDGMPIKQYFMGEEEIVNDWYHYPGRPRTINPSGFYAVSGEFYFFEDDFLKKRVQEEELELKNYIGNSRETSRGLLTMLAGSLGALAILKSESVLEMFIKNPERLIDRRNFMKLIAGGAAGLVAGTGMIEGLRYKIVLDNFYKLLDSSSVEERKGISTLLAYADNLPNDVFVDGRSALLISKHYDAIQKISDRELFNDHQAKGAIVMGSSHSFKGELLMRNSEERGKAVLKYSEEVVDLAARLVHIYKNRGQVISEDKLKNYFIETLPMMSINHVFDTGVARGMKLNDYIRQVTKPVETAYKSREVEEAIKSLR